MGWCSGITDADVKALASLTAITGLQLSRTLVGPPEPWSMSETTSDSSTSQTAQLSAVSHSLSWRGSF
jgi:hypothetical protein